MQLCQFRFNRHSRTTRNQANRRHRIEKNNKFNQKRFVGWYAPYNRILSNKMSRSSESCFSSSAECLPLLLNMGQFCCLMRVTQLQMQHDYKYSVHVYDIMFYGAIEWPNSTAGILFALARFVDFYSHFFSVFLRKYFHVGSHGYRPCWRFVLNNSKTYFFGKRGQDQFCLRQNNHLSAAM